MSSPATLSSRSHAPSGLSSAIAAWKRAAPDPRPIVLAVVRTEDLSLYPGRPFTLVAAHTTADALGCLKNVAPEVATIDWDAPGVDAPAICSAADRVTSVLVTTTPEHAPAALKAGCHEVLLKPLTPSLIATRIGRLLRAQAERPDGDSRWHGPSGTHRIWEELACERCGTPGVTSFEFASHRRMWYACLSCDHVWIDVRRD